VLFRIRKLVSAIQQPDNVIFRHRIWPAAGCIDRFSKFALPRIDGGSLIAGVDGELGDAKPRARARLSCLS
jgi:hypothetical protein